MQLVFRKPLGKEREIVVLRGTSRPYASMSGIVSGRLVKAMSGFDVFPVSVEYRSPAMAPLELACDLVYQERAHGTGIFAVMDVLTGHNQIVIATAQDTVIVLRQICPFVSSRAVFLGGTEWSNSAVALPVNPTKVRVTLNWTKDGLVEAVVDGSRLGGGRKTRLIQTGKAWQFKWPDGSIDEETNGRDWLGPE